MHSDSIPAGRPSAFKCEVRKSHPEFASKKRIQKTQLYYLVSAMSPNYIPLESTGFRCCRKKDILMRGGNAMTLLNRLIGLTLLVVSGHISSAQTNTDNLNLQVEPRFGLRLSLGIAQLETPKLADVLSRYENGSFEQSGWTGCWGIGADVEVHPTLRLSALVNFVKAQFSFHPDLLRSALAQATWNVSQVPISLRVSYLPPFRMGPIRPSVAVGGSFIVSTVEQTSNYAVAMQPSGALVSFTGLKDTQTGWAVNVRATLLVDITKNVSMELHGDYWISTKINQVSMVDTRWGMTTAELNYRSFSFGFSVCNFVF